jgi:4-amino-4-deoxy-L-arabinose transferase-like glycosyltransferase
MKLTFWNLILICCVCTFVACASGRKAFTNAPDTTNSNGTITPGISPATDALKTLQGVNAVANPTPSRAPVDLILGGLAVLTSAVGGWLARNLVTRKKAKPAAKPATEAATPRKPGLSDFKSIPGEPGKN